ncbi:50S ribosomal protein L21 [Oceanomicrobium pacificus]|uniref:Large ribosomal subunit protein bL21 n=1 Tax=Oceanomicrobium pacificus TaxID=2692916 RepID=A0A6B0TQK4_9RHOB|nr:50S ribosomal protein L21 [Oceanomicrobium pacificus]MXU66236.1 50S ribosomal protein L21 [Oceanomicrobium pacificus]
MFAVLKTGGKQYKVAKDEILTVEKLAADAGETVQFNEVLMLGGDKVTVGAPFVDGAAVQAEILDQTRGPKTISFVKRRRKHSSQRKKGHRQHLTVIKVTDILASGAEKSGVKAALGASSAPVAAAAPKKAAPKKAAEKKAAPKKAEKAEAAAATGAAPKNLLKAAKGDADDLKKISGVGPKLEGLLNENGVYHFWQIAEWSADEVAYMDDKLSFKGRIERDNWIQQATDFAAEAK